MPSHDRPLRHEDKKALKLIQKIAHKVPANKDDRFRGALKRPLPWSVREGISTRAGSL
jgi:hypothetical protein